MASKKARVREQKRRLNRIIKVNPVTPGVQPIVVDFRNGVARNGQANRLESADRPVHDWYRFVLSYPPQLVRHYLQRFDLSRRSVLLDPFCGTGTTLVEAKKNRTISVGLEANPMAHFASTVKVDWTLSPSSLLDQAEEIASAVRRILSRQGIDDAIDSSSIRVEPGLSADAFGLLLRDSISPLPLHKSLVLIAAIRRRASSRYQRHLLLALAKSLVNGIGNLHFGPEVGVGAIKRDAPVLEVWLGSVREMAKDLATWRYEDCPSQVLKQDSRAIFLEDASVDAVITSPPYPNEKDYTRTTRLESVLLGFLHTKDDLRALKRSLLRSNTRGVYKGDDDHRWVEQFPKIERIAGEIEARRIALGKTSGFERMYPRVTRLYFGGMAKHLHDLRRTLRPGARLAYVVGDQASYLRVLIRTGQLLAEIADSLGYQVDSLDLFRTRLATATREQLREEVLVLTWPGNRLK